MCTTMLDLSKTIDLSGKEEFYRFAQGYLFSMKQRNVEGTEEFFKTVEYCQNHSHLQSVRKCMGISSQSRKKNNETASADNEIKDWCKKILKHKELRDLSADELNQLMGYCSKRAKIKESGL